MDFTQAYKQSNFLVEFSKGAQWILTAVDDRLIVRRADSFLIERTWLTISYLFHREEDDPAPSPSRSVVAVFVLQQDFGV